MNSQIAKLLSKIERQDCDPFEALSDVENLIQKVNAYVISLLSIHFCAYNKQ